MVTILVGEVVLLIVIPEGLEESPIPNGARIAAEQCAPAEHERHVESHGATRVRMRHRELARHGSSFPTVGHSVLTTLSHLWVNMDQKVLFGAAELERRCRNLGAGE